MKNQSTYQKMAILMAVWMLLTSVGISIDMHYCKGELKSIGFFSTAENCHQAAQKAHCSKKTNVANSHCSSQTSADNTCKKDCCNNELVYLILDTDFVDIQVTTLPNVLLKYIAIPVEKLWVSVFFPSLSYFTLQNYKPPLLNRNILVFVQSFLL